jgi:DOMON domain
MTTTRTAAREMRATSTVLAFVLVVVGAAVAAEALSSPPEYFGGQDNEGYLSWISASPISEWTSATYMPSAADPDVGAAVHWFIDNSTGGTLELAVATKSTGWLAFGMSVAGGMLGADLFVVEAINLTEIKDMHVLSERLPVMDECQNWQLVNAQRSDDGFLLVRVRRALDTEDPQDLQISNDGNYSFPISRVIAAWGDEASYGYHGASRAHSGIRWYSTGESEADLFKEYMETASDSSYLVAASNYSVTTSETEYAYFCSRSSDMTAAGVDMTGDGVTIVGFEPIIDKVRHVHHFILYASPQELNATAECSRGALLSLEMIYLWVRIVGALASRGEGLFLRFSNSLTLASNHKHLRAFLHSGPGRAPFYPPRRRGHAPRRRNQRHS